MKDKQTLVLNTLFRGGWSAHRTLLALALPMILANITTPLVGLVDTAVLGRMHSPAILAGASVAALIYTQVVWVCGFLRMSTTGQSAQAYGTGSINQQAKVLWQSGFLSLCIGLILVCTQVPLFSLGSELASLNDTALSAASDYFYVRVWGFPAALLNLTLIGWKVGQQLTRYVLIIQLIGNLLNAGLNVLFVYGFDAGVEGVALASVVAEYTMTVLALLICWQKCGAVRPQRLWFRWHALKSSIAVNSNMLLRNLILQCCLAFITLQGARYGVVAAGVNAIIMQFFALIALGLDGIAYAVEALVGQAKGKDDKHALSQHIVQGMAWSNSLALGYALVFGLFHQDIGRLLTQHDALLQPLADYAWIIVLLPLLGHWCFLFDGVAIGLTRAALMRNTMLISAVVGFFPMWFWQQQEGNSALWLAMLAFLSLRGITLGTTFYLEFRRRA